MTLEPFQVTWSPERLDLLRSGIAAFRWPDVPEAAGWRFGCDPAFLRSICRYWMEEYDFVGAQAELNRYPQFRVEMEPGQKIHFVHVIGEARGRRPLLLVHGWPGSPYEYWPVIEALAFPTRYGRSAEYAFDLVIPSLPGYAFSSKPRTAVGPMLTAMWLDALMCEVLGYRRYLVEGTDWGVVIAPWMALRRPGHVRGIYLEDLGLRPAADPTTQEERDWVTAQAQRNAELDAYYRLHTMRVSSLAYLAAGNPVGQAAWLLERFHDWSDLRDRPVEEIFSRDQLLTSVNLYVLTDTFGTSAWFYAGAEAEGAKQMAPGARVNVPTGFSAWADRRNAPPPRSFVEKGYNVVFWRDQPRGGHFQPMEAPDLFVDALRDWGSIVDAS